MSDRSQRNLDEAMRFGFAKLQSRHVKALRDEVQRNADSRSNLLAEIKNLRALCSSTGSGRPFFPG